MKNQFSTLLVVVLTVMFSISAGAKEYYASPSGNDSNPGTIDKPFATIEKLWSVLNAGDIGYLRGGTYRTTKANTSTQHVALKNKSGTSTNPIKLWAYPGEKPFINLDNITVSAGNNKTVYIMCVQNCNWVHIKGIRAGYLQQNNKFTNQYTYGWFLDGGSNNIVEQCESDHNCEGFAINNQSNLLMLNCDAHHLEDPYSPSPYDGSNGFSSTQQGEGTSVTFRGCRAWWCCDDGWDFYASSANFTLENCWAFWNGYKPGTFTAVGNGDGIKMGGGETSDFTGPIRRTVNRCVSFQNKFQGFDQNNAKVTCQLYNNTSYGNGGIGYHYSYRPELKIKHVLKNNVSFQDKSAISSTSSWVQSNNTWNGTAATTASFASLTNTGADGPRQADGSLPNLQFLHLSAGSNLINAGIALVNFLFSGSAPDLGAFEYGSSSAPVNQPPVANAGTDQSFSLPTNSATLNGTGTDADGTISAYQWTKVSGPGQYTVSASTSAKTMISNLAQGEYQFELRITDNAGAVDRDTVKLTVNAAGNQSLVANAGANKTITLPTNAVSLDAAASSVSTGGSITSYKWTKLSGGAATIASPTSAKTTVSGLVAGQYTFELTVTDSKGVSAKAQVTVTVNPAVNQLPVANAGTNKTITLPTNSVTLDGSASSDPDGSISSYKWTKISGGAATITSSGSSRTTVSGLVAGQYTFQLSITDNKGASGKSNVTVTVKNNSRSSTSSGEPQDTTTSGQVGAKESPAQLRLYPNPATNIINAEIASSSIGIVVINIYDLSGRKVKSIESDKQLTGNNPGEYLNNTGTNTAQVSFTLPVNISSLGRGAYIMETIIDNRTRATSKFIKY